MAFCAVCVAAAARHFPAPPLQWLVAGGGRRNPAVMRALSAALTEPVRAVEVAGWNGDALEAQAFGVLAARCWHGLPITFAEERLNYTKMDKARELIREGDFEAAQGLVDEVSAAMPGDETVTALQDSINRRRAG